MTSRAFLATLLLVIATLASIARPALATSLDLERDRQHLKNHAPRLRGPRRTLRQVGAPSFAGSYLPASDSSSSSSSSSKGGIPK